MTGENGMPEEASLIADTPLGKLEGHKMISRGGREFLAFSGVPYAKPPIGDLKFQPPQPVEPWTGIKEAKKDGPFALQCTIYSLKPKVIGSEDCLYLSLYTHKLSGSAPVLVYFHGGGFLCGNGPSKTGPLYLMDEDVVVVMVNFRVGIFGFLSFEDEILPGNMGLKDQVMALRWVQSYISYFGGDPSNVVLLGNSAGSVSISYHLISDMSRGLFHKAICLSGSCYCPWCTLPPGHIRTQCIKALEYLGYKYNNTKDALEFLMNKDPYEVASVVTKFQVWQMDPFNPVGPCFEPEGPDSFIVGRLDEWKQQPVPMLIGTNVLEGISRTRCFVQYNMDYKWYTDNFEAVTPGSMMYSETTTKPDEITKAVRQYYLPDKTEITEEDFPALTLMHGDISFTIGSVEQANRHPGNVYFFYFDYRGEKIPTEIVGGLDEKYCFGTIHNEEMIYLYNQPDFPQLCNLKGEDLEMSKKLIKFLTTFAKYGTPVAEENSDVKWDCWTPETHRYLHINKEGFHMKDGFVMDKYKFWKSLPYMDKIES